MSSRSKREHKPTSKFLHYYSQEISSVANVASKNKKLIASTTITSTPKRPLARKKTAANTEPRVAIKPVISSPSTRKSNRQHKPNEKLKNFLKQSLDEYDKNYLQVPPSSNSPKRATRNEGTKGISKKCVATVSPMIRKEGIKTPFRCSKHITVGLVDCFEGLTNDLAQIYPSSDKEVKEEPDSESPSTNESEMDSVRRKKAAVKRSLQQEPQSSSKKRKVDANLVRNLTKTKKTKITTVVETVGIDVQQTKRTVIHNRKSKLTKKYPVRKSSSPTSEEEETASDSGSAMTSSSSISRNTTPAHNQLQTTNTPSGRPKKKEVPQEQQKDIRETLKKFLIMGTKVANAISETLKHNEEALLSKSSAFEKKCLSLVHALAKQGADLEEDDMEKVLKLLDEEQEERKIYRHTFLESLRVSHLTNMALYSQMLRLLKTL